MRHVFRPHLVVTTLLMFLILVAGVQIVSAQTATAGQIIISEFRLSGPGGLEDEFIEIYNNSGTDHTVASASGTGYGVAASDGVVRCSIPDGFNLPVGGHYLCVNSDGYSLASYPAGNATTATGDATYTTDITENAGLALFNNNTGGAGFSLANRLDAVGSSSESNTLYKEGAGYPALTPGGIDYSLYRKIVGTCTNSPNNCGLVTGAFPFPGNILIQDTDNNVTDFVFVDTNGTSAGAGQRLGAPGPENSTSPVFSDVFFSVSLLDSTAGRHQSPNRERDFTSNPAQNSTFGTISFRRRFTNESASNVSRLRFRIVDQTTFPAVSGVADLRARTSAPAVIAVVNDPATCAAKSPSEAAPCSVVAEATILEQPPSQPNGGAYNSSLSPGTVQSGAAKAANGPGSITLNTPIPPGGSIMIEFLMGIQQTGAYRFYVAIEATLDAVITERPNGDSLQKKSRWTNRTASVTGIIDATPVPSLKAATSSGWFLVVPSRRNWATSTRKATLQVGSPAAEAKTVSTPKARRKSRHALGKALRKRK